MKAEGRIKKDEWPKVALGEVCDVVRGSSPRPKSDPRFYGGTVPRLMVADLTRDGKFVSARLDTLTELGAKQSRPMRCGEVVIAVSGTPGLPAILAHDACIHDGFVGLRNLDSNRLNAEFLYAYLAFIRATNNSQAVGATFKNLTTDQIKAIEVPEFPAGEQGRIAVVLDRAEALRAKRRAALAQLDSLTQSLFLDLFGDPVTNPKSWPRRPFGEVCNTKLGKMLDQKQQTGQHLRPYVRNANVQWFSFNLADVFQMDFDEDARKTFRLEKGDLLICEGGEPGRAAVWQGEIEECYYQKALHRARPRDGLAMAEFLVWQLWFLANRGGLGDHVTSVTIAHLTGEKLNAMQVPLPPIDLQREFSRRVAAVEQLKTAHRASLAELDALFASLQHRAFRGEL